MVIILQMCKVFSDIDSLDQSPEVFTLLEKRCERTSQTHVWVRLIHIGLGGNWDRVKAKVYYSVSVIRLHNYRDPSSIQSSLSGYAMQFAARLIY